MVRHAPCLDLSLSNPAALDPVTWVTIVALADTGADFVMVPHYFADELQIELGPPSTITDFGNQAHQIRFGATTLRIRDSRVSYTWKSRIGFTTIQNQVVLGHAGFFDLFHVGFNGKRRDISISIAQRNDPRVTCEFLRPEVKQEIRRRRRNRGD